MSDALKNLNVAQNPSLIPYAHHAGSAIIKPDDMGKVKGKSQMAMRQQTHEQLQQIYRQIELLGIQAIEIQNRIDVSDRIYNAKMSFEPVINHCYYLYEKEDSSDLLSMISPVEWGKKAPFSRFLAKVLLLADHTWKVEFMMEN